MMDTRDMRRNIVCCICACMPYGPIETSAETQGKCAFCGVQEPDQCQLLLHNASICIGKASRPLTKSRKADLLKHLALHGVSEEDSSTLTNKWCYRSTKKVSCGFCIELFTTIADRLNHIGHEYYENFQDIEAWDLNKVIKGLLLQPGADSVAFYHILSSQVQTSAGIGLSSMICNAGLE